MNARGKGGKSVLVINSTEAVGVRKAFKLFNKAKPIGEIARMLEADGIKKRNGKPWIRENVRDMLDRETYAVPGPSESNRQSRMSSPKVSQRPGSSDHYPRCFQECSNPFECQPTSKRKARQV